MGVFCTSDLHGNYKIWSEMNKFLKPEDTLFVLGDCADRGPRGWDIIKEVIRRPNTIYLKGNHEDMLYEAIKERNEMGDDFVWSRPALDLLFANGGEDTWYDLIYNEDDPMAWGRYINNLGFFEKYVNPDGVRIIMTHAGYTPSNTRRLPNIHDLLWDRDHINDAWEENDSADVIIHGHTPSIYIDGGAEVGALYYCDDHKICLDNATYATNAAVLLNLDTFDEEIFM